MYHVQFKKGKKVKKSGWRLVSPIFFINFAGTN
jgi:hypothetical protein